jgi:hypothetical protein
VERSCQSSLVLLWQDLPIEAKILRPQRLAGMQKCGTTHRPRSVSSLLILFKAIAEVGVWVVGKYREGRGVRYRATWGCDLSQILVFGRWEKARYQH